MPGHTCFEYLRHTWYTVKLKQRQRQRAKAKREQGNHGRTTNSG